MQKGFTRMKRIIAPFIVLSVVLALFASCSKEPKIKDGQLVSDGAQTYAAITENDGQLARDEDGQLIVAVTDKNGDTVKDESGEDKTSAVELSHAVTLGDRIEYKTFSVLIPDGWTPGSSFDEINIWSEDRANHIVIYSKSDLNAEEPGAQLFNLLKGTDSVAKITTDNIKLAGCEAKRTRIDFNASEATTAKDDAPLYSASYYSFAGENAKYGIICYSEEEGTADSVFEDVLNTMVLY